MIDIKNKKLHNDSPNVVSQCYTKTKDSKGRVHNPCFNCHINSREPNYADDWDLQVGYVFTDYALDNHWNNLFKDRSKEVATISDEQILNYVNRSNYFDNNGSLALSNKLINLPSNWDIDGDNNWDGYVPDCYYHFDDKGFDHAPDGNYTGWRAFGYYPFLGTFWPTNGSTDDVLIRLHEDFAKDKKGKPSLKIYKLNLSIVESLIKEQDIDIEPTDEKLYGVDLNKNGKLDTAVKIKFEYDPRNGKNMSYVGLAQKKGYKIAAGLYPVGTEFLHSVRYLSVDQDGKVGMAPRMKELRYGKKVSWYNYGNLRDLADDEIKDKTIDPDDIERFRGDAEKGISNKMGWRYQGFIEDENGDLRPQSYEENLNCIGCHANLGSTVDSTFVFPRKFDKNSFHGGWFHWSQKDFTNIPEPKTPDGGYEYTLYLQENGAGDEFRDNKEVMDKFFDRQGLLRQDAISKLHKDISYLLIPSPRRALQLDKAYKVIVDEQSFIYGRAAHIKPIKNVYKKIKEDQETGIKKPVKYKY